MNLAPILYAIGSIGPFSTRVFLPALITALLLRFGADLPLVQHLPNAMVAHIQSPPTWFTSNPALIVLAILSVLEVLAQKNPEARQFLSEFDIYLKVATAALSSFGVLSATDSHFLTSTFHQAGIEKFISPMIAALGVLKIASVRREVIRLIFDHIEGTHLDHLLSWAEDAGSAGGIVFVMLLPFVALGLLVIATGFLFLIRRRMEKAEQSHKLACSHCGEMIFPSACACPRCKAAVPNPCAIGFFGQSLPGTIDDPATHPYRLAEKRRCSVCATHLRNKDQPCPACGTTPFISPSFVEGYVAHVSGRLPMVLGVGCLLGLIPLLGMIAGVVFYRTQLILPFAEYLSAKDRFLLRWALRLLFIVLVFFQVIPVIGAITVPVLALLNFFAYRSAFLRTMTQTNTPAPTA